MKGNTLNKYLLLISW